MLEDNTAKEPTTVLSTPPEDSPTIDPSVAAYTGSDVRAEELIPAVEKAVLLSSRKNVEPLVKALRPVVGKALRGSVRDFFRRIVVSINRCLLHHFSIEGIKWRFEAARTGKSFADVVLKHSLVYPVAQVFLIHRSTGLLLHQVKNERTETQDGDMVSSMLTAIEDFVHDSFNVDSEYGLQTIKVGEMTVLIEQGPLAILAGVVQGHAPDTLRETFQQTLKEIHGNYEVRLASFQGETEVFEDTTPYLESCLKLEYVRGEERVSPFTAVVLLVPLVALGALVFFTVRQHMRWEKYLAALSDAPGIVVIEDGLKGWRRYIRGFRDPMAQDPDVLLVAAGFSPDLVTSHWEPYRALEPSMTQAWARYLLKPPSSVSLMVQNGSLIARGTASEEWISRAALLSKSIPGVSRFVVDRLVDENHDLKLRWRSYLNELAREPGFLVTEKGIRNGKPFIVGFRDPMARDPAALLAKFGLKLEQVKAHWEPFEALHPDLLLARAKRILDPPHTVTLALRDGRLSASGSASHTWVGQSRILARTLTGISAFDTDELVDADLEELNRVIVSIESQVFYFLANKTDLWPGQEGRFRLLLENIKRLKDASPKAGVGYLIEIRGHTGTTGNDEIDQSVSESIARRFLDRMRRQRLDADVFTVCGMGASQPEESGGTQRSREGRVSFKIVTTSI